jgi:hypothetical protein
VREGETLHGLLETSAVGVYIISSVALV